MPTCVQVGRCAYVRAGQVSGRVLLATGHSERRFTALRAVKAARKPRPHGADIWDVLRGKCALLRCYTIPADLTHIRDQVPMKSEVEVSPPQTMSLCAHRTRRGVSSCTLRGTAVAYVRAPLSRLGVFASPLTNSPLDG